MSSINPLLSSGLLASLLSGQTQQSYGATPATYQNSSNISTLLSSLLGGQTGDNGFQQQPAFGQYGGFGGGQIGSQFNGMQNSTAMSDRMFSRIDANGDGCINKSEFRQAPRPGQRNYQNGGQTTGANGQSNSLNTIIQLIMSLLGGTTGTENSGTSDISTLLSSLLGNQNN